MTSFGERSADDRPDLADVGRLARKLVHRAVRTARTEDQPLRRVLLDHLGPNAATLPSISDTGPLYEQVNLQVGLDAWLAEPGREHEAIGITGIAQMRFSDVTIGDLIQAAPGTMYSSAGVGAPVAMNLPCGPDGQTLPCVSNGIYLVRDGAGPRDHVQPVRHGHAAHRDEPPGRQHQPGAGPRRCCGRSGRWRTSARCSAGR